MERTFFFLILFTDTDTVGVAFDAFTNSASVFAMFGLFYFYEFSVRSKHVVYN